MTAAISTIPGLPSDLQGLIDQANAGTADYQGRVSDVEGLNRALASGDHSSAEFRVNQIIERQLNFRRALEHGLPPVLQTLIEKAKAERADYQGRESDVEGLNRALASGDHSSAEFRVNQLIERQSNIRNRKDL